MQRAVKRSGIEDFWRLSEGRRHLPRETREYVPLILAAMVIARNPTQYGFTPMATDKPLAYDSGDGDPRRRPASHRRVDRHAARGDPGPEPRAAPLDDAGAAPSATRSRCRSAPATSCASGWPARPPTDLAALHWYRVKRGESVATIARKLGVSRGDLAEANGLSVKARVRPGQDLLVPRAPTTALAARAESRRVRAARNGARRRVDAEPRRAPTGTPESAAHERASSTSVRRGDTLE